VSSRRVTYSHFRENDALVIRIEDLPPYGSGWDWDQVADWGIDVLVDSEGRHRKYEIARLGDLYQAGVLQLPPGYTEPPYRFELDEAPGRSFTLQELIDWVHDRVTVSA
jgi:hypothetical protein